ncbi:hypothetical protein G6M89_10245 [Natronolimnobius sp. AArcel1]|nr:hypothetical protein [Natronolimnobius sp. AArcel1]
MATILLGFFVRLGEVIVALGPSNPFWNWLEASWTVAWLSVLVVGLWCYRADDRITFDGGIRTRSTFIGALFCGTTIGYSVGAALLIGLGFEGLIPVGEVITGAFLGGYITLAGMAGVTAHAVANDVPFIGSRFLTFSGILALIAAISTVFGYGQGWSDTWSTLLFSVYMFSLVRLQRQSESSDSRRQRLSD